MHWLTDNKKITHEFRYNLTTNFPPILTKTHISKFYLKFMQRVILNNPKWVLTKNFCKQFLIFLCLLNELFKKTVKSNSLSQVNSTLVILPSKNTSFTFLKAPFVNKLSKKHYSIKRYKLVFIIQIHSVLPFFKNPDQVKQSIFFFFK